MTAAEVSHAILRSAAFGVHVALLSTAPFAFRFVDTVCDWPDGSFGAVWRTGLADWRDVLAGGDEQIMPGQDVTVTAGLLGFGSATFVLWLLVPSFATSAPVPGGGDLVLTALLVCLGLACALVMDAASGRSGSVRGAALGPVVIGLVPPALLLAGLDFALIGGGAIDGTVSGAPRTQAVPLGLLAVCLGLAASADVALVGGLDRGLSGRKLALFRIAVSARLLFWIDLVASIVPPFTTASALAGPLAWLVALVAWPLKIAGLAALLGLVRRWSGRFGALHQGPAMLGIASLFGLLAAVFLLIGPGLE